VIRIVGFRHLYSIQQWEDTPDEVIRDFSMAKLANHAVQEGLTLLHEGRYSRQVTFERWDPIGGSVACTQDQATLVVDVWEAEAQ
jgi:hypothetical protein